MRYVTYTYKKEVNAHQLAQEIEVGLGKKVFTSADDGWVSYNLNTKTVDVNFYSALTDEEKAKLDKIVEDHIPAYVCDFCGMDQGDLETLTKHRYQCFKKKLAEATTVKEKVALIEKIVG